MKPAPLTLLLSPAQQDAVEKHLAHATEEHAQGRTGIVAAQIFADHMRVGYIENERAKEVTLRTQTGEPLIVSGFQTQ